MLRAIKVKSLIKASAASERKPSLVYSFQWDLDGVTRREERRGDSWWGEESRGKVRPGTKKEKLIAGTHAQHSIQIMEWLDRTTTFIFARVHRLPPGKAVYLDGINWRAGCVTSSRPILIIKQREHPALASLSSFFSESASLPLSLSHSLSLPSSRVHRLNREFNSRRMINYACICKLSYFKKYISFNRVLSPFLYGCSRLEMITPRFADLIFRGAHTPLSCKGVQYDIRWW